MEDDLSSGYCGWYNTQWNIHTSPWKILHQQAVSSVLSSVLSACLFRVNWASPTDLALCASSSPPSYLPVFLWKEMMKREGKDIFRGLMMSVAHL